MSTPSSLTSLPPETITHIVACIASQPTLCSLARCSRLLYFCTTPHLYRHIIIEQKGGSDERLKHLASLLLRRPGLVRLVRHFTFENHEDFIIYRDQCSNLDLMTAQNASNLSKEAKIRVLEQISPYHESFHEIILTWLLPTLLRVEKVVLHLNSRTPTFYFDHMLKRAAHRETPFDTYPPFEALTVFRISQREGRWRNESMIASLLKLPAIQEISRSFVKLGGYVSTSFDNTGFDNTGFEELESSSSPLASLDLVNYPMDNDNLGHLIRSPRALKTFFYTAHIPTYLELTQLRNYLRPQKTCLERLGLDYHPPSIPSLGPMACFISFSTLKLFRTAAILLAYTVKGFGRDKLIDLFPLSLETLHVTQFETCTVRNLMAVEHLIAQKSPEQVPLLKDLILEESDSHEARFGARDAMVMDLLWHSAERTELRGFCGLGVAQGVSIELIRNSTDVVLPGGRTRMTRKIEGVK